MYTVETFDILIPRPRKAEKAAGVFNLHHSIGVQADPAMTAALGKIFAYYGVEVVSGSDLVVAAPGSATGLPAEGFRLEITPECVKIQGTDQAGQFYALKALEQMLSAGFSRGLTGALLECGVIEDWPRFGYRGFMLDSSRHFQTVGTIKKVLDYISRYRINRFHWHLVDGSAWRVESRVAPSLVTVGSEAGPYYTAADMKEITDYARQRFITIVPEIEMPGHSGGILAGFPQFSCTPDHPGSEFCLGNAEGRKFLQDLIDEFIGYFPDSPMIHLGGDEANTTHWEQCPKCREEARKRGNLTMRQLENSFMNEMAQHVLAKGRIPVGWGTESTFPEQMVVQVWRTDHELARNFKEGHNCLIASVHYNYYFDYPFNSNEPDLNWMLGLPEETVYRAEPSFNAADYLGDKLLGVEAALWTEIVPEWRVLEKIIHRLPAYAESAWSSMDGKQYQDFVRRRQSLDAAGFNFYTLA